MPSSRIPSPARSQGKSTPRRHKPRASRSVGSPARSTSSVKLSAVVQMDSFALSPMPTRRSVLTDTTDIDIPKRKSWWKKLDENSREIMEVLNNKDQAVANNAIEEYIEVDVLSQERKNYTMDIPESSDGESISSIVIPQRKLFTQKESKPKKNFAQIIDNRESLAPLHKTREDTDKTLNVCRKNLFSQGTQQRTKPLFPSGLLNVSVKKTANKTREELAAPEPKGQVKSLFGNRLGTKRKNMFADFVVSDSEDEIPDIQPKVFGFQKKAEQKQRQSVNSRAGRESHLTSPTSSITDIEMDDWRLLPSSTMVDHQLEDGLRITPNKRAKLSKLSEATETVNTENNTTANKTKQSNKSLHSKSRSKNISKFKDMDVNELIDRETSASRLDAIKMKNKSTTKNISHEQSSKDQTLKNKEHSKSKNVSSMKTVTEVACEDNVIVDNIVEKNNKSNKNSKTMSKIDQVLQSDDDEDFNLVYENYDIEVEENKTAIETNSTTGLKEKSNINKLNISDNVNVTKPVQNKSKSQNIIHQINEIGHKDESKDLNDKPSNSHHDNLHSPTTVESECENNENLIIYSENNSSKSNKISKNKNQEIGEQSRHDITNRHGKSRENDMNNSNTSHKEDDDDADDVSDQDNKNEKKMQEPNSSMQENEEQISDDNDENISQEEESNNEQQIDDEEEIEEDLEEDIEDDIELCNDKLNEDDKQIGIQDEEEDKSHSCDVEHSENSEGNKVVDESNSKYENNKLENEDITEHEKHNIEEKQTQLPQDEVDNNIINKSNKNISINKNNPVEKVPKSNGVTNTKGDSSYRQGQKNYSKVASPEAILHDKQSQMESFTAQGRNTSIRKTKSIGKNLTLRPSIAPSTDISNGSRNSSVDGSGWDSHRTTRATLRQTFGKDFTPRKSLRALVMEKSAKRRTNVTENAEISRLPQANSTELPESVPFAMDESNNEVSRNKSNSANTTDNTGDAPLMNRSEKEMSRNLNVSDKATKKRDDDLSNDADDAHEINEVSGDIDNSDEEQKNNESDQEQEMNESDNEKDESDQAEMHETNESNEEQMYNESDQPQENNESDNDIEEDIDESGQQESHAIDDSEEAQNNDEYDNAQEMNYSDDAREMDDESEQEISQDEADNETNEPEQEISQDDADNETNESEQQISQDDADNETNEPEQEISQDDADNETNDPGVSEEINQSCPDVSHDNDDTDEERNVDDEQEMDNSEIAEENIESDDAQDNNESYEEQDVDESENAQVDAQDNNESDDEQDVNESENAKTRQTTLEMYLQKVKKRNLERKKQLEEEIRNSIKAPTRDMINPFKVPAIPKLRRIKPQQTKNTTKPVKSSVIPLNMLPVEMLEDMKYKPPKRYRPTNASWVTKRLYKFLETKLEPKYDYKARIRSEKLVESIYRFTKDIRRQSVAPPAAVDGLKHEMARLHVVTTHFDFYEFFHEYMPREVRVKVVPDVINKIPLPKHGIFSDIVR